MSFLKNIQWDQLNPEQEEALARAEANAKAKDAADKLASRYENVTGKKKPWLQRNHAAYKRSYRTSYILNFISAILGYYGALIIMEGVPFPDFMCPAAHHIGAIGLLYAIEKYKRKFSDKFWDAYWATGNIVLAYLLPNAGMFIVSLALSGFGMFFGVQDFSPEAREINHNNDPKAIALRSTIDSLNASLKLWEESPKNLVSNGEVKWNLRDIHEGKQNRIAAMEAQYDDQYGAYTLLNDDIKKSWKQRMNFRSGFSVTGTCIAEIIFECLMAFCSLYCYRFYRANQQQANTKEARLNGTRLPGKPKAPAMVN